MTEQPLDRAARIEHRFNARFAEYFDTLGTALDAPAFSRFTPTASGCCATCRCAAASGCGSCCCTRRRAW